MKYFLACALLCLSMGQGYAVVQYGACSYGEERINALDVCGSVTLTGTHVHGHTRVNGNLRATGAVLGDLQVQGRAEFTTCSVRGPSIVNGFLTASSTQFDGTITVSSQTVVLSRCSVAAITIRGEAHASRPQVLELRDGTRINGTVVFESGDGEVWLSSNSVVAGAVVGARVVKK